MQLGNFKWESTVFNSRLQPTQIALGTTQGTYDVLKLNYDYGDLQTNGTVDAAKNNGNIAKQTITVPTVGSNTGFSAVQTYTYDSLNRIHDAKENIDGNTTPEWKQTFTYDRFGNRSFDETNTTANAISFPKSCGTTPSFTMCTADKKIFNPDINTAMDNRLSASDGYTFDSSGNTTKSFSVLAAKKNSSRLIFSLFLRIIPVSRVQICLPLLTSQRIKCPSSEEEVSL